MQDVENQLSEKQDFGKLAAFQLETAQKNSDNEQSCGSYSAYSSSNESKYLKRQKQESLDFGTGAAPQREGRQATTEAEATEDPQEEELKAAAANNNNGLLDDGCCEEADFGSLLGMINNPEKKTCVSPRISAKKREQKTKSKAMSCEHQWKKNGIHHQTRKQVWKCVKCGKTTQVHQ